MPRAILPLVLLAMAAAAAEPLGQPQPLRGLPAWPRQREAPVAAAAPLSAGAIRAAIESGCRFLRGGLEQQSDPGQGAMALLALLAAGGDPLGDEALRGQLDRLLAWDGDGTYIRAVRANVWEYALRKAPWEARWRAALAADFGWLLAALGNKEGWRYQMRSTDWDNSVTQYGMLGIWAGARAGLDPGAGFWQRMSDHWRGCQSADGGWHYVGGGPAARGGIPNMATAGLASLFLVMDMHHGRTCWRAGGADPFADGDAAACLAAIARGQAWLEANQAAGWNDGYFLYGIERTGVASGRRLLGGVDWFRRGAEGILAAQAADGSFRLAGHGGPLATSAFAILFLVHGGAPVAFGKLEYGGDQGWNANPRDLANLCRALWTAYERPLNWQSVPITAPAGEIEAPVLFISGMRGRHFAETEVATLREYLRRGGTILAEPADGDAGCRAAFEDLAARLFPAAEYPRARLAALPADHGIYTVLRQEWRSRPALRGIDDGLRTPFIISDGYLAGDWQRGADDGDAVRLAMSLLFYACDGGQPAERCAGIPAGAPAAPRSAPLTVALIRPAAATDRREWDSVAACWRAAGPWLRHAVGCAVEERPPVTLGRDRLDGIRLLHLAPLGGLRLAPGERAALAGFVAAGGTLLAESPGGSPADGEALRRELEAALGAFRPLDPAGLFASGAFAGGHDLGTGLQLNLAARTWRREAGRAGEAPLLAVMDGRRPAALLSPYGLCGPMAGQAAYRALGWRPDSARRIVASLTAWITAE